MRYNKIYNPITNRKVNITSKLGKKILHNYIVRLYGGAWRSRKNSDDPPLSSINPCFKCNSTKLDSEDNTCIDCLGTGTNVMEMSVLYDRITSLKLENPEPDISFRTDIKRSGRHLTKEQLNRFVKHDKDCFPGSLYTLGLINEKQYDDIASRFVDGVRDSDVLDILNKLGSNVILDNLSIDSTKIQSLRKLITTHIAKITNTVMPIIVRTNGEYDHAILVGNDNGIPIIIDTQRTEHKGKYKIMKGKEEIDEYLKFGWSGKTQIVGYTIFTELKQLSEEMSKLSLID